MAHYHFTRDDRVTLYKLKNAGKSNRECARILGFHPSSIGRELARGAADTKPGYSVRAARNRAERVRRTANQQHRKLWDGTLLSLRVCLGLGRYWSPQQIAGRLGTISHSAIYRWLWRQSRDFLADARKFLRHKRYRRKYGTNRRGHQRIRRNKRAIEHRPAGAANRSRYGHWEGDTIVGKGRRGYIATFVERKSGYLLAVKLDRATAAGFADAARSAMGSLPDRLRRTVTLDNGTEMEDYEVISKHAGVGVYFAHPYHSWERGTNENTNGLLRQFFPKYRDFSTVTQTELDQVVRMLNTRPRKRYGYRTPVEVLDKAGIAI